MKFEKMAWEDVTKWNGTQNGIIDLVITQPENTDCGVFIVRLKNWPTASGLTYDMYGIGRDLLLFLW